MKILKIILLLLTFLSLDAFAQWSGKSDIKRIYLHSTNNVEGTTYLAFSTMINPFNCIKKSNKLSSEIYALILSASTVGKQVAYYTSGCDANGYPELLHISLIP